MANITINRPANLKQVSIKTIQFLLKNGYTRWEKDVESTGAWGSVQAFYGLSTQDAEEVFAHAKLARLKSKIPTYVLVDDTEEEVEETPAEVPEETPATILEATPVVTEVQETPQPEAEAATTEIPAETEGNPNDELDINITDEFAAVAAETDEDEDIFG